MPALILVVGTTLLISVVMYFTLGTGIKAHIYASLVALNVFYELEQSVCDRGACWRWVVGTHLVFVC